MRSVLLTVLCLCASLATAEDTPLVPPTAPIEGWGFEVGFGHQVYTERNTRVGVLSPTLFHVWRDPARLVLDVNQARFQTGLSEPLTHEDFAQFLLHLELMSPLYKDLISSYVRLGFGFMTLSGKLYDGSVLMAPITIGVQALAGAARGHSLAFFIDYTLPLWDDFKFSKSLPPQRTGGADVGLDREILFQSTLSFGIRYVF